MCSSLKALEAYRNCREADFFVTTILHQKGYPGMRGVKNRNSIKVLISSYRLPLLMTIIRTFLRLTGSALGREGVKNSIFSGFQSATQPQFFTKSLHYLSDLVH